MIVAVIPAYNEEKTVGEIVRRTRKYVDTVIVVDDCSADSTYTAAKKAGALVIHHSRNMGLGVSLRDGIKRALDARADVIITLDADGQHNPDEIPEFIKCIGDGYDFVLGQRDLSVYPVVKKIGNFFLTLITNFVTGTYVKDTESGFRAMTASAAKKLHLRAEKYEIAVEIIFEVGRNHLRARNIRISSPRYDKGVNVFDGFRNFSYLLKRRKRNLKSYVDDIVYVSKNIMRGRRPERT